MLAGSQLPAEATDRSRMKSQQFSNLTLQRAAISFITIVVPYNCNLAVGTAPQSWKTSDLWLPQQFIVNVDMQFAFAIKGCKT